MKKLLSLSLMLSLGLATVTPALNAAQSQANPADASGWQAAKKWWLSGRNMSALNRQERRAFRDLNKKFTIGAIIAAIVAMIGGSITYRQYRSQQKGKTQETQDRQKFEEEPRQNHEEMREEFSAELKILADRLLNKTFDAIRLKGDKELPILSDVGQYYEGINEIYLRSNKNPSLIKTMEELNHFIQDFNKIKTGPKKEKIVTQAINNVLDMFAESSPRHYDREFSQLLLLKEIYDVYYRE